MKEVENIKGLFIKEDGSLWFYKKGILEQRKTATNVHGYEHCWWSVNNKSLFYKVHRLVAQTFISNPDNLPYVNHIDCNKLNNSISNLEWCTQKHNINHAKQLGRIPSGEKRWNAKLTWSQVNEIRRLRKETSLTQKQVGELFGIQRENVRDIEKNKTWVT